jgi:hypothetical protein
VPREVHRSGELKPFTLRAWGVRDGLLVVEFSLLLDEMADDVLDRIAGSNALLGTSQEFRLSARRIVVVPQPDGEPAQLVAEVDWKQLSDSEPALVWRLQLTRPTAWSSREHPRFRAEAPAWRVLRHARQAWAAWAPDDQYDAGLYPLRQLDLVDIETHTQAQRVTLIDARAEGAVGYVVQALAGAQDGDLGRAALSVGRWLALLPYCGALHGTAFGMGAVTAQVLSPRPFPRERG